MQTEKKSDNANIIDDAFTITNGYRTTDLKKSIKYIVATPSAPRTVV